MTSPLLMGVSGMRGIVGESLYAENIQKATLSFLSCLKEKKSIVVGRDPRSSGLAIEKILVGTLLTCGLDVTCLGICPTPTISIILKKFFHSGGVMITASHNPVQWNGFKWFDKEGFFFNQKEWLCFKKNFHNNLFKSLKSRSFGIQKIYHSFFEDHCKVILKALNVKEIRAKKFKVFLDSVNGCGSEITPFFLERLGCRVIKHNCELEKAFPRDPEPNQKNLKILCQVIKKQSCDIAFVQDPDADRLSVIQSDGKYLSEELTLALAFESVLSRVQKNQKVVVNESSTSLLDAIVKKYDAHLIRTPVGEAHIVKAMLENDAILGGEGNGGVIYQKTHLARDSLTAIGLILELMSRNRKALQEMIQNAKGFHMIKETIPLDLKNFLEKEELFDRTFKGSQKSTLDGFKYLWSDAWIHLRVSNTESILRIFVESTSVQKAKKIMKTALLLLK